MKTKYSSNRELIHIWASDSTPDIEKRANSMSCQHDKLYSYSTVISQIISNDIVIHNTANYSVTTSKQQGMASYATNHFNTIININIPKMNLSSLVLNQRDFEILILEPNQRDASNLLLKASRSKLYKDSYNRDALRIFQSIAKYAALFNLEYVQPNLEGLTESALKRDKEEKQALKEAKARKIKEQEEALLNWRMGLDVRNYFEITALRIKDDVIETTKGAKIPLEHAVKFWGLINSWHQKGITYTKDHHSIHLGNYAVNRFENDVLTVGCHQIPFNEIESIANQLNLRG